MRFPSENRLVALFPLTELEILYFMMQQKQFPVVYIHFGYKYSFKASVSKLQTNFFC